MRSVFVILMVLCAWLAAERYNLGEEKAILDGKRATAERDRDSLRARIPVLEAQVGALREQTDVLKGQLDAARGTPVVIQVPVPAPAPAPKPSWLETHIDRGAKALDPARAGR